jgi:TRAP-type C4-dicarboxylate transport system substrate-binding protein
MKGLKIRIASSSTILRDTYLALGAIPTPLAFSETYTGLESGVIDGGDMGVFDMLAFKVYQVAKFLTLTRQFSVVNPLIVGKHFMTRINAADRQVVREAGKLGADAQVRAVLTGELTALNQLKAKGVQVFEPKDRNAFVAKVQPVFVKATSRVGADIMKLAQVAAAS